MKTLCLFNNKGGVGKTSLVYHLAWMYTDLGLSVVAADLDPQANLTAMFLEENRLEELWPDEGPRGTVYESLRPLLAGRGDIAPVHLEDVGPGLALVPGDIALSAAEDDLSGEWPKCLDGKERAFRVISALWRLLEDAARKRDAALVLIDIGPNLGALNRTALIASDHVVVPLAPDLFSLQGLKNLGPTLRRWRQEWQDRRDRNPISDLELPGGRMEPAGYVVMQHAVRLDRPVKAYARWMTKIPQVYHQAVLGEEEGPFPSGCDEDGACLALLKHYRSLMPLAQEANKPIFRLTPADGAIGGHVAAIRAAYMDFRALASEIADRIGLTIPALAPP